MHWTVLLIAAFFEVCWALTLKHFSSKPVTIPMLLLSAFLTVLNMFLLAYAMKGIPASMAYAVWTGLGASGLAVVAYFWLGEPLTPMRLLFLVMIVAGVVGLKASG